MTVIPVGDDDFDAKVLQSPLPAVVEVWASECLPCPMMLRHLEPLLEPYEGRVNVFSLDASANPKLMERFEVRSTPALLVFVNGQLVGHFVHQVDAPTVAEKLRQLLGQGG